MIDIHCHILPGLDDGPRTVEEAVTMAQSAISAGLTDVITTPHSLHDLYPNTRTNILKTLQDFQEVLQQRNLPLRLHPGSELMIHYQLPSRLASRQAMSLGDSNRFVLIELPSMNIPLFTDAVFDELLANKTTPVLAHPERHALLRQNPSPLLRWVEKGVRLQITAASLLGNRGQTEQSVVMDWLDRDLVHFIASDGHNSTRRSPKQLPQAYKWLYKSGRSHQAEFLLQNARSLLATFSSPNTSSFCNRITHS